MATGIYDIDFSELSAAERLLLAQDLWDSVISDVDTFPMTDEERRWIEQRLAHARDPQTPSYGWQQVAAYVKRDRSA